MELLKAGHRYYSFEGLILTLLWIVLRVIFSERYRSSRHRSSFSCAARSDEMNSTQPSEPALNCRQHQFGTTTTSPGPKVRRRSPTCTAPRLWPRARMGASVERMGWGAKSGGSRVIQFAIVGVAKPPLSGLEKRSVCPQWGSGRELRSMVARDARVR